MKRKLSSASSEASGPDGGDNGLGGLGGQAQPSGALSLEQNTGPAGAGGFLLDPHLSRILGMQPGERIFRSMFYGSPLAPRVSALVTQLLTRQEALLSRGSGEGSSSVDQAGVMESMDLAERNALAIQALMDSVEEPPLPGASHWQDPQGQSSSHWQDPSAPYPQGPGTSHWQDPQGPGTSHWQDPQGPGASHWQDPQGPGASHWQDPQGPGASHWQDPQGPGASHWQDPSTPYPQAPGASHWQDPSAPYPQAPGASHWQDPSTPYPQAPGASHWQDPSASHVQQTPTAAKQSGRGPSPQGGFILATDLAQSLGMQPGQALYRGMFHNTPQSHAVSDIVIELSEVQKDLLYNLALERSGVAPQGVTVLGEDTASLIKTNEELLRALMASIEAPAVEKSEKKSTPKPEEESTPKPEEESTPETKEERDRKFERAKAEVERIEKREGKRLRDRQRNKVESAQEKKVEVDLSVAKCKKAKLEKAKEIVTERMERLEATRLSISKKKYADNERRAVVSSIGELKKVVDEPENLQETKEELSKTISRYEELTQAGAGEAEAKMDRLRTKEARVRRLTRTASVRETKMEELEKDLGDLVARELELEKTETRGEEIDRIRMLEIDRIRMLEAKVETSLIKLKELIERDGESSELELELSELMAKMEEIEANIDRQKREVELSRLRIEVGAEASERELSLRLILEGMNIRIRMLELELGIWLGELMSRKTAAEKRVISMVLVERTDEEKKAERTEISEIIGLTLERALERSGMIPPRAGRETDSTTTSDMASEVVVVEDSGEEEEEEDGGGSNTGRKSDR
ncbi:hypothetical protein [Candidatus Ichthyocystis sparus]|uniref:hypothetical protein n=2 Tax=Candidatus Ichthyocystis sparus TaxID=1561004 RepID=UPI0011474D30|nr:hypothetical protein [Candidatus Ichthyocystis sparus]